MKLQSSELATQAYQEVKNMILAKKLTPGQKIVQDKLAQELGISRTPLRAALQMLEAENLVESIPRNGMVVREFSDLEVIEIYECRMALEEAAIRLFTQISSDKDIDQLANLFTPFSGEDRPIDTEAYQSADKQFHDAIIRKCGNGFLYRLFRQGNLLACMDIIGLVRPASETLPEHLDIINAIQNRQADLAVSLAHKHLEKSRQLIIKTAQGR